MAGGGTILTFPILSCSESPRSRPTRPRRSRSGPAPRRASTDSAGRSGSIRAWLATLFLPSLLGGAVGAVLLLRTPVKTFESLLALPGPVLDAALRAPESGDASGRRVALTATAALPRALARRRGSSSSASSVYGGYFGAGIGILDAGGARVSRALRHPRRQRPEELLRDVHQRRRARSTSSRAARSTGRRPLVLDRRATVPEATRAPALPGPSGGRRRAPR